MQVSWINPEDVASLAQSLRPPPPPPPSAPVVQSFSLLEEEPLEEEPVEVEEDAGALPECSPETAAPPFPAPSPAPAGGADAAEAPPMPDTQVPTPDLQALRQRLQEIRERAVDAGLLPPALATGGPEIKAVVAERAPVEETIAESPPPPPTPFEVPLGSVMARLEAFAAWAHRLVGTADIFVVDDRGDLLWGPQEQAGVVLSTLMALNAAARSSALAACESAQVAHQVMPSGLIATVIPCDTRLGLMQIVVAGSDSLARDEVDLVCGALKAAMDAQG